jgi:hypothetical protein
LPPPLGELKSKNKNAYFGVTSCTNVIIIENIIELKTHNGHNVQHEHHNLKPRANSRDTEKGEEIHECALAISQLPSFFGYA